MTKIWIVEYGYDGIGETNGFSSAHTTKQKAFKQAHLEADTQIEEREEEESITKMDITNYEGNYEVQIRYHSNPVDWWTVRQVPLFD